MATWHSGVYSGTIRGLAVATFLLTAVMIPSTGRADGTLAVALGATALAGVVLDGHYHGHHLHHGHRWFGHHGHHHGHGHYAYPVHADPIHGYPVYSVYVPSRNRDVAIPRTADSRADNTVWVPVVGSYYIIR